MKTAKLRRILIDMDPEERTRLRKLLARMFRDVEKQRARREPSEAERMKKRVKKSQERFRAIAASMDRATRTTLMRALLKIVHQINRAEEPGHDFDRPTLRVVK
jgi:cytochrome P450